MPKSNDHSGPRKWLLLAAAPAEADAIAGAFGRPAPREDFAPVRLRTGVSLVRTGVGKVNAAIGAARFSARLGPAGAVVSVGVCGALPGEGSVLTLTQTVVGTVSVYADEGVITPEGWRDLSELGFGPGGGGRPDFSGMGIRANAVLLKHARRVLGPATAFGPIGTVSTCSGTDAHAREVARRSGAIAEAMEGAAVAHVVARMFAGRDGPGFLELRTVSNSTGNRGAQQWDLKGALAALGEAAVRLVGR